MTRPLASPTCWIVVLTCALALVGGPTARATDDAGSPAWLRLDTAHFTFFSARNEEETRALAHALESMRGVLVTLFPDAEIDFAVPTYLYVFRDGHHMALYRSPQAPEAVGYFVPHVHANYAALDGNPALDPTAIVYRQYISALLAAHLPALPLWLRHGVASFYSTFTFEDGVAKIGLPVRGYLGMLNTADLDQRMPFGTLLSLEAVPVEARENGQFTSQAWGLVHHLLTDEQTRGAVPRLIRALAEGTPSSQAFAEVFDLQPRDLDRRIHAHMNSDTMSYLRAQVPAPDTRVVHVTRPSEAEMAYRLGDLLAHLGPDRADHARTRFAKALALDPSHGLAHAALGALAPAGSAEALEHYARAAALADDDFLVHFLYGESLLAAAGPGRPKDEAARARVERAAEAFRRSTTLRPTYAEAWARLGQALGLVGTDSTEAVAALERALHGLPARRDVAFNLILAYARAGQRDGAEAIVARLVRVGAPPTDVARAREVLLQMDYNTIDGLIRAQALDDAIAVLARIQAETISDALRTRAADKLAQIEPAHQHNQFAARYLQAVAQWRAGDVTAARQTLGPLADEARPGKQQEALALLLAKLDEPPG